MATYRAIAATETDPEAPITSALMKALDGNATAIAEGAAGAPKIAEIYTVSGASATTQTFTGLGDFSGIRFDVFGRNSGGTAQNLTIEYSTNGGSTWSAATTLAAIVASANYSGAGHFNFSSGLVEFVAKDMVGGAAPLRTSTTMAGASLSIDAVRFSGTGASTFIVVMIHPNGGTA